ncbi:uncharacterized protein [Primulina eburnea]|uniref:uncharacterized protein n=1 Tax=Primulina eburnea TaxID=1245227 RepID=UPI003C6BE6A7
MTGNDDFYRIITSIEGCYDEYSSVLEFKKYLTAENLSSEVFRYGWVFWAPERDDQGGESIREKIRRVLNRLMSSSCSLTYMVQFWASMEVGGRSILTTSDQPFAVMNCLRKGESWYRKKCTDHHYIVEDGAENEQLGPPGRFNRNRRPESSPDIRNYTVKEFPLRDHAANCDERSYLALPVFDLLHKRYVGVLEIISSDDNYGADILSYGSDICRELEEVEMRTTHLDNWEQLIKDPLKQKYLMNDDILIFHHQQPSEIIEMLKLASNAIPQLHLAQVLVPCEQCGTSSKSFNCMKFVASMVKKEDDELLRYFFMASKFHNLQNGQGIGGFALSSANKSLFCQNVSDLSISDYTTVHYAREARLSLCFAICLRDMLHRENSDNDLYVFEFFLQPQSSPTNISFVLHLLLKLMEQTLRNFEVATGRHLAENLITDEIRRTYMPPSSILGQNDMFPSGIEVIPYDLKTVHQQHPILFSVPMEGFDESYSIFKLREYLRKPNLHCVQEEGSARGFLCYCTEDDELLENGDCNDSVSEFISTPEKIKILTGKLIPCRGSHNFLIQFWAPKIIKNRLYLSTSDHPFALGHLGRGLCFYRKQCMEHLYHVGDGAKEEELGPPGRVFLTGHQESSLELRLYSTREFPLLVPVIHCCAREYLVLPLFDVQQNNCFGVLECVGLPCCSLDFILDKLKEVDLRSTHVNHDLPSINIDNRRKLAVAEIEEMFQLLYWSAQLQLASAWMPCSQCATTNIEIFCMERVCGLDAYGNRKFQKVNIGKGLIGRVLESKNKMGYFENLGDFSILEYPWAHHAQTYRLEFCFVICLQSSHSANDLYVLEFFISLGSEKDGYPWSYLSFLLSTMKINLKSFKVASGQQLGEHFFQATGSGKEVYFGHEQNIIGTNSNKKNTEDESKTSKRARSYDPRIFEPSRSDLPISNLPSQPNVPLTCIHSSREVDKTHQENDVVTIKAHFNEDIIKFGLCLSSGLEKLVEEVAKRLDLVIENLKLKYKDDDDDWIY